MSKLGFTCSAFTSWQRWYEQREKEILAEIFARMEKEQDDEDLPKPDCIADAIEHGDW